MIYSAISGHLDIYANPNIPKAHHVNMYTIKPYNYVNTWDKSAKYYTILIVSEKRIYETPTDNPYTHR